MLYEQFAIHNLTPGKMVDAYLEELRKLTVLFGGIPNHGLACAFVVKFPGHVKWLLCTSCRIDTLPFNQVLTQYWSIMKNKPTVEEPVMTAVQSTQNVY